MSFYLERDSKKVLRARGQLRASLCHMANALDKLGKTTAPITLPCRHADLCKLGLMPYQSGSFLYGSHPVAAVNHG